MSDDLADAEARRTSTSELDDALAHPLADELDRVRRLLIGAEPGERVHVHAAEGLEFADWVLRHVSLFCDEQGYPTSVGTVLLERDTELADGTTHTERVTIPWHAVHAIQPSVTVLPARRGKILSDDEWEAPQR